MKFFLLLLIFKLKYSVQFSHSLSHVYLQPHGLQHARPPPPTPRVYSNSCPLSCWCHPTISFSVIPFSSHLQSFPESGTFPMSQFFASGSQSISASASVLPMNIQDWFPLGLTGLISFQSKGLSRVFSNTTVQTHQFFGAQPSLYIKMYIRLKKKSLSCPMQTLTRKSEIRIIFLSKTFGSALCRKWFSGVFFLNNFIYLNFDHTL